MGLLGSDSKHEIVVLMKEKTASSFEEVNKRIVQGKLSSSSTYTVTMGTSADLPTGATTPTTEKGYLCWVKIEEI